MYLKGNINQYYKNLLANKNGKNEIYDIDKFQNDYENNVYLFKVNDNYIFYKKNVSVKITINNFGTIYNKDYVKVKTFGDNEFYYIK